jgi:hypothetical protein
MEKRSGGVPGLVAAVARAVVGQGAVAVVVGAFVAGGARVRAAVLARARLVLLHDKGRRRDAASAIHDATVARLRSVAAVHRARSPAEPLGVGACGWHRAQRARPAILARALGDALDDLANKIRIAANGDDNVAHGTTPRLCGEGVAIRAV